MNVYLACEALDIWPIVKARAEVWSISSTANAKAINNLKSIAKNKFKELAVVHHPDKGGENDKFIELQRAHDVIKNATIEQIIDSLKDEQESNRVYFEPGSLQCKDCTKWSDIVGLCITVSCTGFKSPKDSNVLGFNKIRRRQRTQVQSGSFIRKRSKGMGQTAG